VILKIQSKELMGTNIFYLKKKLNYMDIKTFYFQDIQLYTTSSLTLFVCQKKKSLTLFVTLYLLTTFKLPY